MKQIPTNLTGTNPTDANATCTNPTGANPIGTDLTGAHLSSPEASPLNPIPTVRWLMRRDLSYVLRIEFEACADPWGEDEILALLCERNVIGSVAVLDPNGPGPVGYCIYSWDKRAWTILRLAVHPDFQRHGIGKLLVGRLVEKLNQRFCNSRDSIEHLIPDWNLSGQLFLQKCGFRGVSVVRGSVRGEGRVASAAYDGSVTRGGADDADQYLMQRSLRVPVTTKRSAAR
jgi:ribosomal protein S18 acetylase RimI-like enzyme